MRGRCNRRQEERYDTITCFLRIYEDRLDWMPCESAASIWIKLLHILEHSKETDLEAAYECNPGLVYKIRRKMYQENLYVAMHEETSFKKRTQFVTHIKARNS